MTASSNLYNITESVMMLAQLKLIINYTMFQSFKDFYMIVKDTPLNWASLKDSIKIKQHRYPNNSQIEAYYYDSFVAKTASFGRSKWHSMDKLLCVWVVAQYCNLTSRNMLAIDKFDFNIFSGILGVSAELLQFKWLKLIKPYLKNKPWCQAQDDLIFKLMNSSMSKKWTDIAIRLSENSNSNGLRTAKQVRERWINYIDPSIRRDDWTSEEDQQLIKMVEQYGRKWSVLGIHFKRTENNIKNRYNSIASRGTQMQNNRFEYLQKHSSQDSGTKIQQFNRAQFLPLVSQIQIQKMVFSHPGELKVCGYRDLHPNEML